ncbi:MAG: hypothetical protein JW973_03650 [Bacteroidales bacterium]|nr:hypothetical protein [Bacteroidales bacterium]
MKDIFKLHYCILLAFLLIIGCETEDFTDYSTLTPTSPTVSITGPTSINVVEMDTSVYFDVALSVAQVVDVVIYVSQVSGDATEGEDYEILNDGNSVTIPAGSTTGKIGIQVMADADVEGTETCVIQIGDNRTGNVSLTPLQVTFTIGNLTADDLTVDFSWETDVADAIGLDLDPDDVVDLRLLIVDAAGNIVGAEDGASFETYSDFSTLPDGTYLIATDIYATIDAGDFNEPVTLSLALEFNQTGVINEELLDFPDEMTNEYVGEIHRNYLATVVKSGSSYTFEKNTFSEWIGFTLDDLVGTWSGLDDVESESPSQIVTTLEDDTLRMVGIGCPWMTGFWGEDIIDSAVLAVEVDLKAGEITIPEQYYFTTTYEGEEQPAYNIVGSGTINFSDYTMVIEYTFIQDGWDPVQWCFDNGYMGYNKIVAEVSLDEETAGKIASRRGDSTPRKPLTAKPSR